MTNDDKVSVVIGGESFSGWLDADMDSDLFTQADGFRVTAALPPADIRQKIREGAKCDIYVGTDRQMTGVIDDVTPSAERGASRLSIVGRDLAAYLIDNESPKFNAKNLNVKTLAEKMIDPAWGISVVVSNEDNRKLQLGKADKRKPNAVVPQFLKPIPRSSVKIDGGQRISQILDIHTKRTGITWWMTAKGELFLGKPNYKQEAAYHFQVAALGSQGAKDNNVERWSIARSMSDRYSEIVVNGTGLPKSGDIFNAKKGAGKFTAKSVDKDLQARGIKRKLIIGDSDITTKAEAQQRADLELQRRSMNAFVISLTVPGFRYLGSRFFATDTIATVKIEEADIDDKFYVTQRRFKESRGQQRTELRLHPVGVWMP